MGQEPADIHEGEKPSEDGEQHEGEVEREYELAVVRAHRAVAPYLSEPRVAAVGGTREENVRVLVPATGR